MRDKNRLHEVIKRLVSTSDAVSLTANMIADEAMKELDPRGEAPELVRLACLSQLRQIAELMLLGAKRNQLETQPQSPLLPFCAAENQSRPDEQQCL